MKYAKHLTFTFALLTHSTTVSACHLRDELLTVCRTVRNFSHSTPNAFEASKCSLRAPHLPVIAERIEDRPAPSHFLKTPSSSRRFSSCPLPLGRSFTKNLEHTSQKGCILSSRTFATSPLSGIDQEARNSLSRRIKTSLSPVSIILETLSRDPLRRHTVYPSSISLAVPSSPYKRSFSTVRPMDLPATGSPSSSDRFLFDMSERERRIKIAEENCVITLSDLDALFLQDARNILGYTAKRTVEVAKWIQSMNNDNKKIGCIAETRHYTEQLRNIDFWWRDGVQQLNHALKTAHENLDWNPRLSIGRINEFIREITQATKGAYSAPAEIEALFYGSPLKIMNDSYSNRDDIEKRLAALAAVWETIMNGSDKRPTSELEVWATEVWHTDPTVRPILQRFKNIRESQGVTTSLQVRS